MTWEEKSPPLTNLFTNLFTMYQIVLTTAYAMNDGFKLELEVYNERDKKLLFDHIEDAIEYLYDHREEILETYPVVNLAIWNVENYLSNS